MEQRKRITTHAQREGTRESIQPNNRDSIQPNNENSNEEPPLKEGFLKKQGKPGDFFQKVTNRWFVLNNAGNLSYYERRAKLNEKLAPLGEVELLFVEQPVQVM
jgi:hypothetical protein